MGRGADNLINKIQERPAKEAGDNYYETAELFSLLGIARRNGQSFFVVQNLGEKAGSVIETVGALESRPLAHFELGDDNLDDLLESGLAEVFEQPFLVHIKSDGMHDEEFADLARALNDPHTDRVFTVDGTQYPLHDDLIVFLESNNMNSAYHPEYADEALVIGETWLDVQRIPSNEDEFAPFRKIADYKKAGQSLFTSKDHVLAKETAAAAGLPFFEIDSESIEDMKSFDNVAKSPSVVYLKSNGSEDILERIKESKVHNDSFVFLEQDKGNARSDFIFIQSEK